VGYEVYLRDGSRGDDLWERIMEAGKPHQIRPTGPSDIRRIEAGILNWGADMTLDDNVYEAGLGWLVDEDKADPYIGREALRRIKEAGPTRKLVGIEIEGNPVRFNSSKWPVQADGQALGRVTSAIYSPRLEKNIGYAWVPAKHAAKGTHLTVTVDGAGDRPVTVVQRPFIDPKKDIPKS
jgi:glycine cleavage system aminomethyltransferase T